MSSKFLQILTEDEFDSSIGKLNKNVYVLGGLFDTDENKQEYAFQKAIERVNANRNILPRAKLVPQIENSVQGDSFRANKKGLARITYIRYAKVE